MQTYPGTVNKLFITQGASYAIGTIIDAYLPDEAVKVLYEKWQPGWPTPLGFSGGEQAITCEMILEVSEQEDGEKAFVKAMGKRLTEIILSIAKANAGR